MKRRLTLGLVTILLVIGWALLGPGNSPGPFPPSDHGEERPSPSLSHPESPTTTSTSSRPDRTEVERGLTHSPSELPKNFIRGRVTNRRSEGIPGAEVQFWATVRNRRYPITIAQTDAAGYYIADSAEYLAGISPIAAASGSVLGNASAENYQPLEIYFENQPGRNHRFTCDFVLRDGLDHRVIGRVLKQDGSPAAFAEVDFTHLEDDGSYGAGGTTTDSEGYYFFDHYGDLSGESNYRMVAALEGAGTAVSSELIFGDQTVVRVADLTLGFAGEVIEGYLLYPNGLPAKEARVVATNPDAFDHRFKDEPVTLDFDSALNGQPQPLAGTITDSRGWFRLSGLAQGDYLVRPLGDRLEEDPVRARSGDRDVRLTYHGHRLSLEITDPVGRIARGANFEVTWNGDDDSDLFDPIGQRLWFHVEPGPATARAASSTTYAEESSFTILEEIHETEVRLVLRAKDSQPLPWGFTVRDSTGHALPWSKGFVFDETSRALVVEILSQEAPPPLPANSYRLWILAGERPWPAIPDTWYFPIDEDFKVRSRGPNAFTAIAQPGGRIRIVLRRAKGDRTPIRDVVVRTVGPTPASHRFVRENILERVRKVDYWKQRNALHVPIGPDVPPRLEADLWEGGETYVTAKPISTGPQHVRFESRGRTPVNVTVDVQPMKFTDVEIHVPRVSED